MKLTVYARLAVGAQVFRVELLRVTFPFWATKLAALSVGRSRPSTP